MREGFDRHPRVRYHDTDGLFFDGFPFKVVLRLPRDIGDRKYGRYLGRMTRHCPEDESLWRMRCAPSGPSMFFLRAEDALRFIAANAAIVADVWRPVSDAAVQLLARDAEGHRPIVRDSLYYDRFRYCVVFRRGISRRDETDIDEWAEEFFLGSEADRALYSYSNERRLYLNDATDVFMATLAYKMFISKIERIILRTEIHGREIGIEADRDAGHQAGHGD